jgi:SAM-dependent methyltransferase
MSETLSLEASLRDLILSALGADYTSVSPTEGIETGNNYQSVALGDFQTSGFREDRARFLDRINFEGKKVLDLGSNLGEVTRAARARGASLVDGFEADPYFLEIAELISVFTGTTRVSFFQRDIADPATFNEHYDIVLAFAVFGQGLRLSLPRVAEMTGEVMVVETHRLEGNFDTEYVEPISEYFPYHRILGESEWGSSFDRRETRAVVVFAKEEAALMTALRLSPAESDAKLRADASSAQASVRYIDVKRTRPHDPFFSQFDFKTGDDLLQVVQDSPIDLDGHAEETGGPGDNAHWLAYLQGYCQYRTTGTVGLGNVYYDHLVAHAAHDPGIEGKLTDPESTAEYIRRQFEDLDSFRKRAQDEDLVWDIAPLQFIEGKRGAPAELVAFEAGTDKRLRATRIDGWHRLFAARVFDVPRLPVEMVTEHEVGPIRGNVDHLDVDGGSVRIQGWCLDPQRLVDRVELSAPGSGVIGACPVIPRHDVGNAFPHIGHAVDSGIQVEGAYELEGKSPHRFEVTAFSRFLPVGRLIAYHLDGRTDFAWPEEIAQRFQLPAARESVVLESVNCLEQMLEPIARYRTLSSFESVLDWGSRCGLLEVFLAQYLPGAQVTAVDPDREAVEWCGRAGLPGAFLPLPESPPTDLEPGSFDLVLGCSIMSRLRPEEQDAWLDEISRLTKPRAYLALSLNGELMRPLLADAHVIDRLATEGVASVEPAHGQRATYQTSEYSRRLCEKRFEVITYKEGAVNNAQDLIVLRKR